MISTVVGSYPICIKKEKSKKNKLLSTLSIHDPFKTAIQHSVESQLKAGIDIISDGQVRGNMIEIFAKNIPSFKIEENTFNITSKITKYHHKTTGASDLKLAIKYMNDFLKNSNFTKKEKDKKAVKGIVTGPCTIIQSSKLGSIYKDKNTAMIDMAHALIDECISLEKHGAKMIQIDEPFMSTGLIDMKTAKTAINLITDEINIPVSLHSCGEIKNILKKLINFNVDILDCEFAGHPSNLDTLNKYSDNLKNNKKKIGLGVINTKKTTIDSINNITKIIKKGIKIMGKENLIIDPDCGMKPLNDKIAYSKLKNMVEATNKF